MLFTQILHQTELYLALLYKWYCSDEGVNFAVQQGLKASRSKVVYFKHNDIEDLENCLKVQAQEDRKVSVLCVVKSTVVESFILSHG